MYEEIHQSSANGAVGLSKPVSSDSGCLPTVFAVGEWSIHVTSGELVRGDRRERLEPKVMGVLVCLARRAGEVVGKQEILDEVWPGLILEEGALARSIYQIRKVLGDEARAPTYVETLPKRGYRLLAVVKPVGDGPGSGQPARALKETAVSGWVGKALRGLLSGALALAALVGLWGRGTTPGFEDPRSTPDSPGSVVLPWTQLENDSGLAELFLEGRGATSSVDAYHAFSRGRQRSERLREEDRLAAVELFERAIRLDPAFAQAHAALATEHFLIYRDGGRQRTPERLAVGKAAAERALELAPGLPQAHVALGLYHHAGRRDYEAALEHWGLAARDLAHNGELMASMGGALRRLGRFDEALEWQRRGLAQDPRSALGLWELGNTLQALRRYDEAMVAFDRAFALVPDQAHYASSRAVNRLLDSGDVEGALRCLAEGPASREGWALDIRLRLALLQDQPVRGLRLLSSAPALIEDQFRITPRVLWEARLREHAGEYRLADLAYEAAEILLRRELVERPGDHRLHSALAESLAAQEHRQEALRHAQHAVALHPLAEDALTGPFPLLALARVETRLGEVADAQQHLDTLLEVPAGLAVSTAWLAIDPWLDFSPR